MQLNKDAQESISDLFCNTLKTFFLKVPKPVPLHAPSFTGNEEKYVAECIKTGWVSSVGSYVDLFEEKLAEYTGAKKAVVTTNGTSALHLALVLSGVQSNDEVLLPAFTFAATGNAVLYANAIPHFVDISTKTLGVDPDLLRDHLKEIAQIKGNTCFNKKTNRPIRALIPMHCFGHPAHIDKLVDIAEEYKLFLIEDAAESLGSFYKNKHTGTFAQIGALSFNGNKTITTGGGGALLFSDETLAKKAKHLSTTAKIAHPWEFFHDELGYNYRMPNLNAALGVAQLEQLDTFLENKRLLLKKYEQILSPIKGITLFKEPANCRSNYWLHSVLLESSSMKESILKKLHEEKILIRPAWNLLSTLPAFNKAEKMSLKNSEFIFDRLINLPSSPSLVQYL